VGALGSTMAEGGWTAMKTDMSRRRVLQVWGGLLSFSLASPEVLKGRRAEAQAKATRQQVQYQDTPKNKQECSNCLQFIAPDACKLVAGKINPKGWCLLYAVKPAK
jgi:hypothetical protein